MKQEQIAAFWAKVEKSDGCWLWTASKDGAGYGLFGRIDGKVHRSHRVSWALEHGEFPSLCVLHRCDNPSCVRPDHLFLGTRDDNMRDRQEKGRQARGESNGRARLTAAAVVEARTLRRAGTKLRVLAERYGVPESTIAHACSGRSWRHL